MQQPKSRHGHGVESKPVGVNVIIMWNRMNIPREQQHHVRKKEQDNEIIPDRVHPQDTILSHICNHIRIRRHRQKIIDMFSIAEM